MSDNSETLLCATFTLLSFCCSILSLGVNKSLQITFISSEKFIFCSYVFLAVLLAFGCLCVIHTWNTIRRYRKRKKKRHGFFTDLTNLSQTFPLITMVTDRLHGIHRYIERLLAREEFDLELLLVDEDEDNSETDGENFNIDNGSLNPV